jgi:hypothetical protein
MVKDCDLFICDQEQGRMPAFTTSIFNIVLNREIKQNVFLKKASCLPTHDMTLNIENAKDTTKTSAMTNKKFQESSKI